ncbi:MAG: DUF1292 domain-containing protein [Solibacillus sp.]
MEEQIFILQTEDGGEQECRVVFTFDSEDHSYVLFTLVGEEDQGVSALRYTLDENGEMADFGDIETDEEWAMVEEVMNTLISEFGQDQTNYITITDDNGEDVICRILHRFELKEFGKDYLFYAFSDDEDGITGEIFAASYVADETGAVQELMPIETDAEWAKVEEVLTKLTSN